MARRSVRALRLLLAVILALGALAALPPAPASAEACVVKSAADSGAETLRAHLANLGCDAITFALAAMGTGTIALASTLPTIGRNLTITGPGRDLLTIDGGDAIRPLTIASGTVAIADLTVARGRRALGGASGYGGCVAVGGGTVTLRDLRVRDCVASSGGGGIVQDGGALTIERSELRGNTAAPR